MDIIADLHKWYQERGTNPIARHGGEPSWYNASAVVEALKEIKMASMMAAADIEPMPKSYALLLQFLIDMAGFQVSDYTDQCSKGGPHKWGTDGVHTNEFCKKCFRNKPEGSV